MPQGPMGDRIPFEGVLNCWNDDHDLPDLLLAISRSGKTGRLHFSNPEGDKTLDLRGGNIVFAESSSQDDGLGQYLLRTGKISLMDYTRVSRLVQPGKRLGALLVNENVLAADDLVPAVVGQVRSVILGLFRRTETWYRFKEEELTENETITLDLPVPELILEGVRYVESWRRVSKGVGSLESVYRQADEREQEWLRSHLDDDVRELVDMLATPTTLQDICTRATLPDFEACRYLWAFRALGWIDVVDEAALNEPLSEEPEEPPLSEEQEDHAHEIEMDAPAATPADTPTLPSIQPPVAASTPDGLNDTRLEIDPPAEPAPLEQPQAPPAEIPERLIQTQVSVTPPTDEESPSEAPPARPAPKPIPEHLNQTQLAVEPPESARSEPTPIPDHLTKTQIAVDPATPTPSPTWRSTPAPIPDELLQTQVFEAPSDVPAAPRSTGELMESILDGEDPVPPEPRSMDELESPPTEPPKPAAAPNQAVTQFFEGPSALDPLDADLAIAAPEPEPAPAAEPATTTQAATPPAPEPPPPPLSETPSGFEALALGGGLGGPSAPAPPPPPRPAVAPPTAPADVVTQPSVQLASPEGDTMASFSDLALPEPAVPLVEAEVVTAEPETEPPGVPGLNPEEPLLPPSMGSAPIERESLVPPRRHTDEVIADQDDFGHILGNDD